MSNSGNFTGHLHHDSPHLRGLLERYFSNDSPQLNAEYQQAFLKGLCYESEVRREDGVSFNPRPARLASLLISEGECRDPALVKSAIALELSVPVVSLINDIDTLRHLHMAELSDEKITALIEEISDRADGHSTLPFRRLITIFAATLERCQKKYR